MKHAAAMMLSGILLLAGASAGAETYYPKAYERAGTWEATAHTRYQASEHLSGYFGTEVSIDHGWGLGFGGAYNLTNHWNFRVEASNTEADYTAVYRVDGAGLQAIRHELDHTSVQASAVYHFLEGNVTPFVQAGLGWNRIDSNVAYRSATTCWWDAWGGYYECDRYYDTYDEDGAAFTVGAGVRWDIVSNLFLRATLQQQWVDLGGHTDDPTFTIGSVEMGWKF